METSPLGAARIRRRLTVEEVAERANLEPEAIEALEEGRIYRFASVHAALRAVLLYATALGISEREARRLAGLPVGPRLAWSLRRWLAVGAFAAACFALLSFAVTPKFVSERSTSASAEARPTGERLPPRWEVEVDVYNGTRKGNGAASLANEIAGLAYRVGRVENANRSDYVETRVYYPPRAEAIAKRLADELGVKTAALPGGKNPRRLVVIVGQKR